jgi:uracil-DNA glycosylase family protein
MTQSAKAAVSALQFLPAEISLPSLREAAQRCRGCPLYQSATQAVFGEGSVAARVVLVGEQPGNDEDLAGRPFVGSAGRVLDQALSDAGIDRSEAYVTNVVKHFKWTAQGKRRLHKKPGAREIAACLPWLEKELELIKPEVLVCLGATAAQALLGSDFKVSVQSGQVVATNLARHAVATLHPSAVLRQPTPEDRHRAMERLTLDLGVVARLLQGNQ